MGYSTARFIGEFHESFVCAICFDVFKDPVAIKECEHIFCRECLDTYINIFQSRQPSCPQDRALFTKDSIVRPARYFMSLYEELKIKCDFFESGCREVTTLGNRAHHLENCYYNIVDCEKNCGFSSCKQNVREHDCVEYLKEQIHFVTQEKEQGMNKLTAKVNNLEQDLLKARRDPDIKKLEEAIVKKAHNAIKELFAKIDFNEGVTRLWPHFVEGYAKTVSSPFRYVDFNKAFSAHEKETIANATLKAIVKENTFEEIAPQIYLKIGETLDLKRKNVSVYCNDLFSDFLSNSGKFLFLFVCDIGICVNY